MKIIISPRFFSCPTIFCKENEAPRPYNEEEIILNSEHPIWHKMSDDFMVNGRFWTINRKDDVIEMSLALKDIKEKRAKIIIPLSETELRKIGYLRYGKYRDVWLQKKNWRRFEDKAREEIEYVKAINLLEETKNLDFNQ